MASIKVARTALAFAGIPVVKAQVFMDKLNATFGTNWTCNASGIVLGGNLLLSKYNFSAFLDARPLMQDVTVNIPLAPLGPVTIAPDDADYFENDNGTFSCAHCDHKPYKTEKACLKRMTTVHSRVLIVTTSLTRRKRLV